MAEAYDIVVIGAGPAGAAAAARLAEGTRASICVIEAGEDHIPRRLRSPAWQGAAEGPSWERRAVASDELGGRRVALPAGKGPGGSELLAPPVWMRAAPQDFDRWDMPEWDWTLVREVYETLERRLRPRAAAEPRRISRRFAAAEGAPASPPDPGHAGFGLLPQTLLDGRRLSCWDALAAPLVASGRLNLRVGARVARVLFTRWRASGVELVGGARVRARGGVVLCAGPLETPAILMRSGIGPSHRLAALGIDVAVHAAGVGEGLTARPMISVVHDGIAEGRFDALLRAPRRLAAAAKGEMTGPLAMAAAEAGGFLRAVRADGAPDLELRLRLAEPGWPASGAAEPNGLTMEARLCRPLSRGRVALAGADPRFAPRVSAGLLTREEDRAALRAGLRRMRALFDREEFDGLRGPERSPGRKIREEEALDAFLTAGVTASGEFSGGCAMGPGARAPLDGRMRVRGIESLWVCDSAAMPAPVSAGGRAAAAVLGWRGGGMIVEDLAGAIHDMA